jgi:Ser/Thr protein kinase RdoA (MazF antagonist)
MKKPFSTLSERGQTRRMMHLARKALEAYALPVVRVTPLKQVYNKNFRITSLNCEQYMLRICHPRRSSTEPVHSELLWLAALNRETELHVPEPVLNQEKQYITVIDDEDVPGSSLCLLFRWIKGRFLYQALTPPHLFQVGELMARLQNHAAQWELPAGFTRRRVDNLFCLRQDQDDHFDETVADKAVQTVTEVSTPQDGKLVEAVILKVWSVLKDLGEGPDTFGLIHADLHQWNYLFDHGQVGAIDFDDCGFGHWLYDLSVTLYCLRSHPDFDALRRAFLAGYRSTHSLTTEHEALINTFMALRTLQDMLWDIEERSQPAFSTRWSALMQDGLCALRDFNDQWVNC